MPTVTATQVITDAYQALNIYMPGDTVNANDNTTALRWLNLMMGQWAQQSLTIPAEQRFVFTLVANKGSSTNPYTIGPGGDLNTTKPPNQNSVVGAGLILNASTPPVEIPRGVMTNQAYDEQRIKDLTSTLFTDVFYLPTFAGGLGSLFLWPVPTDLTNSGVLYIRAGLSTFADLTTTYSIPDGYDAALFTNLAVWLQVPFGRTVSPKLEQMAMETLNIIRRSNLQLSDLQNDFSGLGSSGHGGVFNIQTGEPQ